MYPERFRVVHQEGIALIRRTGRFLKRHVDHAAAAAGASLLAACASAPESRATSGPPATPASVATQEATSATEAQNRLNLQLLPDLLNNQLDHHSL